MRGLPVEVVQMSFHVLRLAHFWRGTQLKVWSCSFDEVNYLMSQDIWDIGFLSSCAINRLV